MLKITVLLIQQSGLSSFRNYSSTLLTLGFYAVDVHPSDKAIILLKVSQFSQSIESNSRIFITFQFCKYTR